MSTERKSDLVVTEIFEWDESDLAEEVSDRENPGRLVFYESTDLGFNHFQAWLDALKGAEDK